MEITNEIKLKVFAQYLGQKALTNKQSYKDPSAGKLSQVDISTNELVTDGEGGYYLSDTSNTKLILKPLSAISDEDAIEVCKLQQEFKEQKDIKVGFYIDIKNNGCLDCIIEWDGYKHDYFQPVYSTTYQFLQSKGYDLPQYLLGGKTLQECGLAIYDN